MPVMINRILSKGVSQRLRSGCTLSVHSGFPGLRTPETRDPQSSFVNTAVKLSGILTTEQQMIYHDGRRKGGEMIAMEGLLAMKILQGLRMIRILPCTNYVSEIFNFAAQTSFRYCSQVNTTNPFRKSQPPT